MQRDNLANYRERLAISDLTNVLLSRPLGSKRKTTTGNISVPVAPDIANIHYLFTFILGFFAVAILALVATLQDSDRALPHNHVHIDSKIHSPSGMLLRSRLHRDTTHTLRIYCRLVAILGDVVVTCAAAGLQALAVTQLGFVQEMTASTTILEIG